ncbi:hypothetical protein D9M68_745180 [compost metagenome]
MALRVQEVNVEKAVQDLTAAAIASGERGWVIASLCDHLRIEPRWIEYEIAKLIFVMQPVAKELPQITWRRIEGGCSVFALSDRIEHALAHFDIACTRRRRIGGRVGNTHPHQISFPSKAGKKIDDAMNIVRAYFEPNVDFHRGKTRLAIALTKRNDVGPQLGTKVVNIEAATTSE